MKKITMTALLAACFMLVFGALPAFAVPTSITVRARANDAKFIGTAVGGLEVTVKDFYSGRILASGTISGGTGDTDLLMKRPIARGEAIAAAGAAGFTATLNIKEPRKLLVELDGPMSAGGNIHKESKTVWLVPGENMTGDGIIFNLYGLIVAPYIPVPHEFHTLGDKIKVAAHISPMCGCPIMPGFLWNASDYTVKALVIKGGKKIAELPMTYAGRVGDFVADFIPKATGTYQFIITAADKQNNQGVAIRAAVVSDR